jgi:tripartite-type tricarboxylate transporter receptor subunit TctC
MRPLPLHNNPCRALREEIVVRIVAMLAWSAMLMVPVFGQGTYPDRPVRLVVGFPAGGPTDGPARVLAEKLRNSLGQPVVVENKPGAGGKIAVDYILGQPRDGYTLLVCTYIDAINTVMYRKSSYKLDDLAPVSLITNAFYAIAVSKDLPVKNIQEFIAYAKARPTEINYGHVGAGSAPELVAKRFERATGVQMTGIPYKGMGDALQEMVAGRLHFAIGPLITTMPLFESDKLRVLAMTSPQRLAAAPNVPTLTEQGVPIVAGTWLGVCAAKGTPQAVIDLVNRKVVEAVASDEYRALMQKTGVLGVSSTPEAMAAEMRKTEDEAGELIRALGLQRD